ncbi:hypothetical protein Q1695_004242 [Nippostrongylus brasiliensis]|nr:hypothetical protein Q1695_004242 [Nippostrongylus brasiliensis]
MKARAIKLKKGSVIGRHWQITKRIGEGAFGAVYKVRHIDTDEEAALKAEYNRANREVLKIEALILRRLEGRPFFPQILQSGRKTLYSYIVMTKVGKVCTISTQIRLGINMLYGLKQLHDIGFIHRDLKPANMALGLRGTPAQRFIHYFDFGLSREYIILDTDGRRKMRRPRAKAHFRGTVRYCSANALERGEQGRPDDLWALIYVMAELRGPLPWRRFRDRNTVLNMKRNTPLENLLANCPLEMMAFAEHVSCLNYYIRPDYSFLYYLLEQVMTNGSIRFNDPYDWEVGWKSKEFLSNGRDELFSSPEEDVGTGLSPDDTKGFDEYNPFPAEFFASNPLGF